MKYCLLALGAWSIISLNPPAFSQDRQFGDFDCTDDCSGHSAGFNWANTHSIDSEENCPDGNSQSFHEGCVAYTRDPSLNPDEDSDGHQVGEPVDPPEQVDE